VEGKDDTKEDIKGGRLFMERGSKNRKGGDCSNLNCLIIPL